MNVSQYTHMYLNLALYIDVCNCTKLVGKEEDRKV